MESNVRLYIGCDLRLGLRLFRKKESPLILQPSEGDNQAPYTFLAKADCLGKPLTFSDDLESLTNELNVIVQAKMRFQVKSILSYHDAIDNDKLAALTGIRSYIIKNNIPVYDTFQGGKCPEVLESGFNPIEGEIVRVSNRDFGRMAPYFVR